MKFYPDKTLASSACNALNPWRIGLRSILVFITLVSLTGCIANNQDWTKKPATKTDYVPGQCYQLLTNVYFSSHGSGQGVLYLGKAGIPDSMLDPGTRLRVLTVHYNGDSFEMGFFTTVRAEAINGPFQGTNFDISFLSHGSSEFLARDPNVLVPVEASAPDLNTDHFAWAASQITEYHGEYTWDWWKRGKEEPKTILPVKLLVNQKQNAVLLYAFKNASTAEGKAYALAALKRLDDNHFPDLAQQLKASYPTLKTYHNGIHTVEPTADVLDRLPQDIKILYPRL